MVTERSKCCNAKVKIIGKVTMYYICTKCKQPCDIIFIETKLCWKRNLTTKIKKSKKIYNRKNNKKQIEED